MIRHSWDTEAAFLYCTLTDVHYDTATGNVKLDSDKLSGSLITDIKDSTRRFNHYEAFEISKEIPVDTTLQFFYRTSRNPDDMGEWQLLTFDRVREEIGMSVFTNRFIADYDIKEIVLLTTEDEFRSGLSYEDSGRVGYAVVGYALVGASGNIVDISDNGVIINNTVNIDIDRLLTEDQENLVIRYVPKDFIPTLNERYIQFKVEFTAVNLGESATVTDLGINYRLNHLPIVDAQFPLLYRRL